MSADVHIHPSEVGCELTNGPTLRTSVCANEQDLRPRMAACAYDVYRKPPQLLPLLHRGECKSTVVA